MRAQDPELRAEDVFRTSAPFESLDTTALADLPESCRSPELFFADELIGAVVDDWCHRTVAEVGGADAVAEDRRFAWDLCSARVRSAGTRWSERALADAMATAAPGLGSTFDLIATAGQGYPAFLRGEVDAAKVLLAPKALPLWPRYFDNSNLSYAAINRIAAQAAATATAGKDGLAVLEVGGGCGSGAESLLEALGFGASGVGTSGGRVAEYRFTELAPFFLARGERHLRDRFPDAPLRFDRVDLAKPLVEQEVPREAFDLVYAVNVLHAVRDLDHSLAELHACLRPGGILVLGETVRPRPDATVPIEFVSQLTPQFREVVLDARCRPAPGFLYYEHWRTALERAGFAAPRFVPDLERVIEAYPSYSLAAVVAQK